MFSVLPLANPVRYGEGAELRGAVWDAGTVRDEAHDGVCKHVQCRRSGGGHVQTRIPGLQLDFRVLSLSIRCPTLVDVIVIIRKRKGGSSHVCPIYCEMPSKHAG
jgi:hypothetical protein